MSHATTPTVHCPTWCTVTADEHAAEAANPISSWYRHSLVVGSGTTTEVELSLLQMFDPSESDDIGIHVGAADTSDDWNTIAEARALVVRLTQMIAAAETGAWVATEANR